LDFFPQNSQLTGFDSYNYGREPWLHNMSHSSKKMFTSVVPREFRDFNPILSTGWYDLVWQSNIHLSLTGRRGSYNLTHLVGQVAKNWTCSSDGLNWTVILRKGLKFHGGYEVTADDVVFSYKAALECPDSKWKDDMTTWFNSANDIKKIDNYTVQFTFREFFPYVTSQVFGVPILSKVQMAPIPFEGWKIHDTNLGTIPLLGCGPYEFSEYQYKKIICHKVPTWNASLMGHDPAASGGGIWWENMGFDSYIIEVDSDSTSAVSKLNTGIVDLLDRELGVWRQRKELEMSDWVKIITYPDYGYYEIGYNHYDPRWGLNPQNPREMYPDDYRNMLLENIDFPIRLLFGSFFIITIIILLYLINRNIETREENR
jgi:ABC-type transport system substrate-binding protein